MPDDVFESDNNDEENFADLFESYMTEQNDIQVGDKINGEIIAVGDKNIFINTGTKTDGVVEKSELLNANKELECKTGDMLDLYVVSISDGEIIPLLSFFLTIFIYDCFLKILKDNSLFPGITSFTLKSGNRKFFTRYFVPDLRLYIFFKSIVWIIDSAGPRVTVLILSPFKYSFISVFSSLYGTMSSSSLPL